MSNRRVGKGMPFRAWKDQEPRVKEYTKKRNLVLINNDEALLTVQGALRELVDAGLEKNGFELEQVSYDKSQH